MVDRRTLMAGALSLAAMTGAAATIRPRVIITASRTTGYGRLLATIAEAMASVEPLDLIDDIARPTDGTLALWAGGQSPHTALAAMTPIGLVEMAPMIVIGRRDLPALEGADLPDWLTRSAGATRVAAGTWTELNGFMALATVASVKPHHVRPADGESALSLIAAGRADLACVSAADAVGPVQAGDVKAFAITAEEHLPVLWDVPTAAEIGWPLLSVSGWSGLYLTVGADPARWNAVLQAALAKADVANALAATGHAPPPDTHRSAAAHAMFLAGARERFEESVRATGMRL